MWFHWFGRMSERRVERARREVSVSNIIADVCVPTALLGNSCCVRVVCWAVGGAPSRVRAVAACRAGPHPGRSGHISRRAGTSRTRFVHRQWQCIRGASAAARHGPRRAYLLGGPPATSWPALSRHRCGVWAGDASGERRPLGSNWAARGSAAPRGAVSVPAFRRPARPDACRVI